MQSRKIDCHGAGTTLAVGREPMRLYRAVCLRSQQTDVWMPAKRLFASAALAFAILATAPAAGWTAPMDFEELVTAGQPALAQVETLPDAGRDHIPADRSVAYATVPPTSGPHYDRWIQPGVHDEIQPRELLVHSLEHGNIVIYLDKGRTDVPEELVGWARKFTGQWDGVIITRLPDIGDKVILTAWERNLELASFNAAAAAAFIDAYRGRGPENPVR